MDLWKHGSLLLLVSLPILKENLSVLARFGLNDDQLKERGLLFLESPFSTVVHPTSHVDVIKKDPTDNLFLDCALEGRADFVVSGDNHLLEVRSFRGMPIVSPARLLQEFLEK